LDEIRLRRAITDLSWPEIFDLHTVAPFTNPPVAIRLSLPTGSQVTWTYPGSEPGDAMRSYGWEFSRPIGRDGKPYDSIRLLQRGRPLSRTNFNVFAQGTAPTLVSTEPPSGQPPGASMRLVVDGVSYNNVLLRGAIDERIASPLSLYLNPTFHQNMTQWAVTDATTERAMQVILVNGLAGTVTLADAPNEGKEGYSGVRVTEYEVRIGADGLPYEVITFRTH
jgi:hypothetical protein